MSRPFSANGRTDDVGPLWEDLQTCMGNPLLFRPTLWSACFIWWACPNKTKGNLWRLSKSALCWHWNPFHACSLDAESDGTESCKHLVGLNDSACMWHLAEKYSRWHPGAWALKHFDPEKSRRVTTNDQSFSPRFQCMRLAPWGAHLHLRK